MKKIISFFFLFLLTGCISNNSVNLTSNSLPSWYLNPPKSTQNFVYITGSGIDKKEALLNALNNFIARYGVIISSKFESKSQDFGGLYNKKSSNEIKAIIKEIEVSNYEIIKAKQYSFDRVLVLVKVDKNKLFTNLRFKLDEKFKDYKNEYYFILKENLLKQFILLKNLYKKIKKDENYIYFLKAMNKNFNEKYYLSFIEKVKNRLDYLKNNLFVEVISNNRIIANDIKKYLTKRGLKIGKSDIKIEINVTKKRAISKIKLIKYQININVKFKNSIIGSNLFEVIAPLKTDVNGYLYDDIKNLSLDKFLNLG